MKQLFTLILIASFLETGEAQQPRFLNPIDGIYGQDYIIVNYVDWEVTGFLDYECGTKTYDGHQGTDFVLRSFPQMDSGVAILAVDTGIVIAIHDGEFDRETVSDPSKGLGNFIGIKHSGDLYTYYGHLKKNSILPGLNETVLPGQKIAEAGSSGNSTDPHLHFELWFDSLQLIDPFMGACGNPGTYWLNPLPYDDNYGLLESGLLSFVPTLDGIKERPEETYEFFTGMDTAITFWNLQYGVLEGDVSRVEWISPAGSLWFSWEYTYGSDSWYNYFWTFIDMPPSGTEGDWSVIYYVNNEVKKEEFFKVSNVTSTSEKENNEVNIYYWAGEIRGFASHGFGYDGAVEVYNILGEKVAFENLSNQSYFSLNIENIPFGLYMAVISKNGKPVRTLKFNAHYR